MSGARTPDLSSEAAIEQEFQRRLAELRKWRQVQLDRLVVPGDTGVYAVGLNQFNVSGGGRACTAIALTAILYVLHYIAKHISDEDTKQLVVRDSVPWDNVAQIGAGMACSYLEENPGGNVHVSCTELMKEDRVPQTKVTQEALEIVGEHHGHTDPRVVIYMDKDSGSESTEAVLNSLGPHAAAVFTCSGSGDPYSASAAAVDGTAEVSVAVMRPGNAPTLWVYDSHGAEDTGTKASLRRFERKGDAAEALLEILGCGLFSATRLVKKKLQ